MKTLTIVSAIYPFNFYCRHLWNNFNAPELQYRNGYFAVIGVMVLIVMGMIVIKKRHWF
jgi:magnesium transporter